VINALRLLQDYRSCLESTRLRKPHQLLVLALFRNESHVLAEWVEHYLTEGATAIHLINNNSTDDFLSPLQDFIASGIVTLHHDTRQHCQRQIYNEHLQRLRSQCRWLLVCDLDEFIYARGSGLRISDLLKAQPMNVSCIHLPWKMFGSSGRERQPKSVRSGFVSRANADAPHPCKTSEGGIPGKTIARASRIRSLDVHTCNLSWGRRILPNGEPADRGSFQTISEAALATHPLHLNHYAIQSLELFRAVKMTRGDGVDKDYDRFRDLDYFRRYDTNAVGDDELAIKSRKAQLP
jgi:hypothetical protein